MKKLLISATLALMIATFLGVMLAPENIWLMFVSQTPLAQTIRLGLIPLLFVLLITRPPRSVVFRALLGLSGVVLLGWAGYSVSEYQLNLFDIALFTEVAIIFGLESLELTETNRTNPRLQGPLYTN